MPPSQSWPLGPYKVGPDWRAEGYVQAVNNNDATRASPSTPGQAPGHAR